MELDIESEKLRLEKNINALDQHIFRMRQMAFAFNESKEYYQSIHKKLTDSKARSLFFCYDYDFMKRTGEAETNGVLHPELKDIHSQMQEAYKRHAKQMDLLIDVVKSKIVTAPPETKTQTNPQTAPETLQQLITHPNSRQIVEAIKIQYKNIKGKRLKLLLMALQELDLLPAERIASKFHSACKSEFDWNIASYNAMNGYNYNERTDKTQLRAIKGYLENITK